YLGVQLRDRGVVISHHAAQGRGGERAVVEVAAAVFEVTREWLIGPAGQDPQLLRVIHLVPGRRGVERMMRLDEADHQQAGLVRLPLSERLDGAVADPGGRLVL